MYRGYVYANKCPEKVLKVVGLDVGAAVKNSGATRGKLWAIPYQLWFAITFWIGAAIPVIGPIVADLSVQVSLGIAPPPLPPFHCVTSHTWSHFPESEIG
jgi:hypothetical protein